MKLTTSLVTFRSRQTSHAKGMETPFTRRDFWRASAISNSLDLNLPLSTFRWTMRPIGRNKSKINCSVSSSAGIWII